MPRNVHKKITLFGLLFFFILQQSFAQTKTVTGTVTDEKGSPVAGASITAKGSKRGGSTDSSGHFSFTAPAATKTLEVSSVGYSNVVFPIKQKGSPMKNDYF